MKLLNGGSVADRSSVTRCSLGLRSSRLRCAARVHQSGAAGSALASPLHQGAAWGPSRLHTAQGQGPRGVACRATLDSPEIVVLVKQMIAERSPPGPRDQLKRCIAAIDALNEKDPTKVPHEGDRVPYRLLYSSWVSDWVQRLDPGAPDELFILARGKSVESWRLSEIKRDDYSPNTAGQKQWEADRRAWMANRLKGIMKDAGYPEASCKLVEDFMLNRDLPDPRDVRLYDLQGLYGSVNNRLLELLLMQQTLRDAEALVFLERSFPRMFQELPADEVLPAVRRELAGMSRGGIATALQLKWTPLQEKLLRRALPAPPGFGDVLREVEGVAAASTHPGDWRFRGFDYE